MAENKKISEIGRMERVMRFMASVFGSEISMKKISDMMASDGFKMLPLTVDPGLYTGNIV